MDINPATALLATLLVFVLLYPAQKIVRQSAYLHHITDYPDVGATVRRSKFKPLALKYLQLHFDASLLHGSLLPHV